MNTSKQTLTQVLHYIDKELSKPNDMYNQYTYEFDKGYKRALREVKKIIKENKED